MPSRRAHHLLQLPCPVPGCSRWFQNQSGLTQHRRSLHPTLPVSAPSPQDHPRPSCSPSRPRDFSLPPPDFSPPPRPSSPILPDPIQEDVHNDAEFTDASERCYRTYHSTLNGKFHSSLSTPFLTQMYA